MKFVAMRLPAQATDGIETECVFESTKPVFSRWQVRCKNTTSMTIDDVAKAVGLTHVLKSNVIVMVNTGEIDTKARLFADRVMAGSNLSIVMIDRNDLNTMCNNPDHIVEILEREAHHARTMRCMEF
jgi:site-specific DNA-methyltransferase (cytosine-N4-specific)